MKLNIRIADWRFASIVIFAAIMLLGYGFFYFSAHADMEPLIFNSPDETANYTFAKLFSESGTLQFEDSANILADGLIVPRSMRVINGLTSPASFLGLPLLYGSIAKITGADLIPLFTPLLSAMGLIFFYLLIKELFSSRIAFYSTVMAGIFPGWWYYSAKGLMPNVPFMAIVIIAIYLGIIAIKRKNWLLYMLSGAFLALGLAIRTSEIVWLAPVIIFLLAMARKKINYFSLLLGVFAFIIAFSPVFYFNFKIYGSPFSVGYDLHLKQFGEQLLNNGLSLFGQIFLPFGFHIKDAIKHLYDYTAGLFSLWSFFFIFGWIYFLSYALRKFFKEKKSGGLVYLICCIFVFSYIAVYYGSWTFNDNPDPSAVTIGTSYARYFLPIYLFSMPPLAIYFENTLKSRRIAQLVFFGFIFCALFLFSFNIVMLDPQEGLIKVRSNIEDYTGIARKTAVITPSNAVIIAEKMDKAFFKVRRVIYKLNVPADYGKIKKLTDNKIPVYIFHFIYSSEDLAFLNYSAYNPAGLRILPSIYGFSNQGLYPIISNQ